MLDPQNASMIILTNIGIILLVLYSTQGSLSKLSLANFFIELSII